MVTHCFKEIVNCVTDKTCKAGLDCLQGCSFNDQVCIGAAAWLVGFVLCCVVLCCVVLCCVVLCCVVLCLLCCVVYVVLCCVVLCCVVLCCVVLWDAWLERAGYIPAPDNSPGLTPNEQQHQHHHTAQVCQYRCIVSYETKEFGEFSLCILQKHNCRGLSAEPPVIPSGSCWCCCPGCGGGRGGGDLLTSTSHFSLFASLPLTPLHQPHLPPPPHPSITAPTPTPTDPAPMTTFQGAPLTHEAAEGIKRGWLGGPIAAGAQDKKWSWLVAAGKKWVRRCLNRLVGWLVGWLVCWLAGWLVGIAICMVGPQHRLASIQRLTTYQQHNVTTTAHQPITTDTTPPTPPTPPTTPNHQPRL